MGSGADTQNRRCRDEFDYEAVDTYTRYQPDLSLDFISLARQLAEMRIGYGCIRD